MTDYQRIAEAIRFLDTHRADQPDLATLASHLGLSPSHFHRIFRHWAGATPKDFLQCLTLADARKLLRQGKDTLHTALESGLSGPGRLHDLCVTLDAATPGEIKQRGRGLAITAGFAETPFGHALIATTPRGICHLSFFDPAEKQAALATLTADWPLSDFRFHDPSATALATRIFQPAPAAAPLKLHVRGTAFQLRVWRALLEIPPGTLASYSTVATRAGTPKATRATGTAVGSNPISYLIPCHRVIRETGVIGNYRWGPTRKRAILAYEQARHPSPT
ncbi:MAG: methylated-DNA--[protein]-cysteine S-methyltransferase [Verrucomicrobiota bacterium JB025]|nr:methylated-DNA--[protein]-cysteine S-methyltransferase [Verrucomicrobiota bacterium JB025]